MLGALLAIAVLIILGALRDTLFPRRPGETAKEIDWDDGFPEYYRKEMEAEDEQTDA